MATQDDTIETLNLLAETCKAGELGLRGLADRLQAPELRSLLRVRADLWRDAADDLRAMVDEFGGAGVGAGESGFDKGGSAIGALHLDWLAARTALAGCTDAQILDEIASGQEAALDRYRKALAGKLRPAARSLIERQLDDVKRSRTQARLWGEQARAAQAEAALKRAPQRAAADRRSASAA